MDDPTLLTAFNDKKWDADKFTHRDHLRVAWLYLRANADFATAASQFREALKRFTELHGVPQKFHETLTWAYLALIREEMDGHSDATSEAFLDRCPQLLDHRSGALSKIYDVAAIAADDRARRMLVLPRRAQ